MGEADSYLKYLLKGSCLSYLNIFKFWDCQGISSIPVMCARVLSHLSCPTLCNPMDCSPPGSSVHGVCSPATSWWKDCSIQFLLMIFISQFFTAVYVHIGILNVCTHVHMQTHINKLHLYWKTKRILLSLWNVLAGVVEQDPLPLCENLW